MQHSLPQLQLRAVAMASSHPQCVQGRSAQCFHFTPAVRAPCSLPQPRNLGIVNMASATGKYDLRDLSSTTAPLWFLGRANATSATPVLLEGVSVALPRCEFNALAAGLGASAAATAGERPSPALNHSMRSFELGSAGNASELLVFSLVGLAGVYAEHTRFHPADNATTPFPAALPDDTYGNSVGVLAPARGTTKDNNMLAIGLSVSLACTAAGALGAAAAAVVVARRRKQHAASKGDGPSSRDSTQKLRDTNGTGCSHQPNPAMQSDEQQQSSSDVQGRTLCPVGVIPFMHSPCAFMHACVRAGECM